MILSSCPFYHTTTFRCAIFCSKVDTGASPGTRLEKGSTGQKTGGIKQLAANPCNCADLMEGTKERLDVFS